MNLLAAGVLLFLLAGLLACLLEHRPALADTIFRWGAGAGCVLGLGAAAVALAGPPPAGSGSWGFGLDWLSAWFVIVVLGPGAAAAVYGVSYLAPERPGHRPGSAHLLLAVLLAGLVGVMTAATVLAFLVAFEVMAVSAYLLVVYHHEDAEVRRAGLLYIVLTHVSILALLGMFAAWGGAVPETTFAELAGAAAGGAAPVTVVLVLALVAFGIKAGAVPGHFWLPSAHAAAPSHISALLSGVVLKSGVYGLLRVVVLLGPPPAWWGWTVLLLGLASAVLGVLWALAQHDLKRLLAYHSVENVGIILLGLGVGALGQAYERPVLSILGYTGAVLHTLNHALFKSLLFLGAGVVVRATGTREIDRLGGLSRSLPRTGWAFLLGSLAIVGLPPLNGFVSEWLVFRGLLEAGGAAGPLRAASAAVAGLALTGALALACFTKLHGVLFLGSPRDARVSAPDAERGLVAPQWALAAACVLLGLLPSLLIPAALRAATVVLPRARTLEQATVTSGATTITLLALGFLAAGALLWCLRSRRREAGAEVRAETWGCAYPTPSSRMQYTASSYAASLLGMFGALSGSRRVRGAATLEIHAADPVLDRIGRPLWDWVRRQAQGLRRIQTGRILWYLSYVIATLLGLLLYLWRAGTG